MAIKPVRPGGWAKYMVPTPAELAQIDQRLAAQGLSIDPAGDTVTGTLSVAQDPVRTGVYEVSPSMTGSVVISGAGATLGTGPGGGKLICTGSVPTYTATRTRRVRFSMLEIARSFPNISGGYVQEGNTPVVDPVSGGITQAPTGTGGFGTYPSAQIHLPIAKPHHGATITSVALYFYYGSSTGGTFSFSSGQITLQRVNVTTGAITSYGPSTACPTLAQNSAFTPYSVSITGLTVAVDLTAYVYRIMLQDVAQSGLPFYWTGGEVNYSGIANEEFSQ